jgi:hypothetical protein
MWRGRGERAGTERGLVQGEGLKKDRQIDRERHFGGELREDESESGLLRERGRVV